MFLAFLFGISAVAVVGSVGASIVSDVQLTKVEKELASEEVTGERKEVLEAKVSKLTKIRKFSLLATAGATFVWTALSTYFIGYDAGKNDTIDTARELLHEGHTLAGRPLALNEDGSTKYVGGLI